MTIKLNSAKCRLSLIEILKSGKRRTYTGQFILIEHPTYYQIKDEDVVYPKLFYSLEDNNLYSVFYFRRCGTLNLMHRSGVI